MGKKECKNCKHRTEYVAVNNQDHKIYICDGDGWDETDDGAFDLMEVSGFDATDCMLFRDV